MSGPSNSLTNNPKIAKELGERKKERKIWEVREIIWCGQL